MYLLIGGAWPYANGSLHIGHLAALLPGDVLARYYRAKGEKVCYVSGSDCHGTPVVLRAKQEGKTPEEVSSRYHDEFADCFEKLGFSYDLYGKTSSPEHKDFVKAFHRKLYESGYVCEKSEPQAYCEHCGRFLPDRYVTGECPTCGEAARGDQCDACGRVLEPETLLHPKCAVCGNPPVFKESTHLFLKLSELEKELRKLLLDHPGWKKNAAGLTKRYIEEGLRDRALTRDLDWGIEVPKEGYEGKKIYIWAENILGYLSMSRVVSEKYGWDYQALWGSDARHYYVHGKDNIPFHTIILPALLIANGGGWHLPDDIISSEYLTLNGKKISTSRNYAIWAKDLVGKYNPDAIRYYLLSNGPEKRDADFTWSAFSAANNSDLVGVYGNFVNRTLKFIAGSFEAKIPGGKLEDETAGFIKKTYGEAGIAIESGEFRQAIEKILELARFGNKYFDERQPWITKKSDISDCGKTLFNCVQLIANLAVLLKPFLPFSSSKVQSWLGLRDEWKPQFIPAGFRLPELQILFERFN